MKWINKNHEEGWADRLHAGQEADKLTGSEIQDAPYSLLLLETPSNAIRKYAKRTEIKPESPVPLYSHPMVFHLDLISVAF